MFVPNMRAIFLPLLILSAAGMSSAGKCNDTATTAADYVFLFDTSSSMCHYNLGVAVNFQALVLAIGRANVDAQVAVGTFGGPTRMSPFTTVDAAAEVISNLSCHSDSQEASLEAIRRVLNNEFTYDSPLKFRPGASLNVFLVTDEDSDLPVSVEYQLPNQAEESNVGSGFNEPGWVNFMTYVSITDVALSTSSRVAEPGYRFTYTPKGATTVATSTLTTSSTYTLPLLMPVRTSAGVPSLSPAYQQEVDLTAQLIAEKNAKVSIVMKRNHNDVWFNILDSFSPKNHGNSYDILCATKLSSLTANETRVRNAVTSRDCSLSDPLFTWSGAFQFGSVNAASENSDYTGFDWETTLERLSNNGLKNSLQAQVLRNGTGLVRLYDIDTLAVTSNSGLITNILEQFASNYNYCQTSYSLVYTTLRKVITSTHQGSTHVVSITSTVTVTRLETYTTQAHATVTSIATVVVTKDELTTSEQISTVTTTNVDEVVATVTSFMTTIVTPTTTTASSSTAVPSSGSSKTPIYVGASIAGAAAVAAAAGAFFYFRPAAITDASVSGDALTSMTYNPLFAWQTQWNTPSWETSTT